MRYDQAAKIIGTFNKVIVTGPARSGTAIATEIIACDVGLECIREWRYGMNDAVRFKKVLALDSFVVQASTMSHVMHKLVQHHDPDILVVFMFRDVKDIIASQRRIDWDHEPKIVQQYITASLFKDDVDLDFSKPSCEIRYDFWDWQKCQIYNYSFLDLDYESLRGHPLWLEKDERATFLSNRTSKSSFSQTGENPNMMHWYTNKGVGSDPEGEKDAEN